MKNERTKILVDNEKYIAKGVNEFETDSDEDDEGGEGTASTAQHQEMDEDSEKEEKEFKEIKKKLKNFKEKEDNMDDLDDEDESDSDYEYTGGDLALYDSALDDVDELLIIKEALSNISQADGNYFQTLMSGLTPEEYALFNDNMQNAEQLK